MYMFNMLISVHCTTTAAQWGVLTVWVLNLKLLDNKYRIAGSVKGKLWNYGYFAGKVS